MTETNAVAPIALITGGSRGIGRSIVEHVLAQGSDVIFTYQQREDEAIQVVAEAQARGRRAIALQLDISDSSSFAEFAERVKGVLNDWGTPQFNFLVNNAGVGTHGQVANTTEQEFDKILNVHLKGPLFLTQQLLPLIADGGRIVNISTALTRVTFLGQAVYASAKAGLEVLTKYLAAELGPRKITVNAVAPGGIVTDFGGGAMRDPKLQAMAASMTALGRMGEPDDVGSAVAAILSPAMGWVTGQRIETSGGQNL